MGHWMSSLNLESLRNQKVSVVACLKKAYDIINRDNRQVS